MKVKSPIDSIRVVALPYSNDGGVTFWQAHVEGKPARKMFSIELSEWAEPIAIDLNCYDNYGEHMKRGGLFQFPVKAFIELCIKYLEAKGYTVTPPASEDN